MTTKVFYGRLLSMDKPIRISVEDYRLIELIQNKEEWTLKKTLSKAIQFYAKVKRLTPWDKLPKNIQKELIKKAKDLVVDKTSKARI